MIRRTYLRLALAGMLLCLLIAGIASPQATAYASTLTVTNTADSGTGSLRAAVAAASPGDMINFAPGLNNQTIFLNTTEIDIGKNLTITTDNGSGGFYAITIQQTVSDMRIFNINAGTAVVTIAGLKLTGAHLTTAGSRGAAIFNGGTLTLNHVQVTGNTAEDSGGGIWNRRTNVFTGSLTVLNSTIDNNTYTHVGGANGAGIYNQGSTFGAPCSVATPCLASLTVVNSTISSNVGPNTNTGSGEGIFALLSNVDLIHTTVAFNRLGLTGDTNAGNVYWGNATGAALTFRETIIADSNNSGGSSWDIGTNATSVNSQGYNDIQNRNATNITSGYQGTDLVNGTDPLLTALANNGGPTPTHALPGNSPAINIVPAPNCTNQFGNPILVDQRDSERPSPTGGICDIGSYEKAFLTVTPATIPVGVRNSVYTSTTLIGHGGKAPYSFSIGGGALPNGLSLNASGTLSGTPTQIGSFTFGVNVTDAYGATTVSPQSYTILVFADPTSTVTVNTNADPGAVNCASTCSLRTALAYASSGDTIDFSGVSSPILLNNANGTLNIQSNAGAGNPNPLDNLIIQGPASPLAIDGNNNQRPFTIAGGITVTVNDLTLQHGKATSGGGGAILNNGSLTVNRDIFSANAITTGNGGAINNPLNGPMVITGSTFAGNSTAAGGFGGAIENFGSGLLTVTGSTFGGNSGSSGGGAIDTNGPMVVSNSTFNNNTASIGGAINSIAAVTVSNSTISGNSGALHGGGIRNNGSTLSLLSDIIAKNISPSGPDVFNNAGTVTSFGHNLIGDGTGSGITAAAGDQIGTTASPIDPLLGPLASNGGLTQTMALPVNSPAYQTGDCTGAASTPLAPAVASDQRGQTRKTPCDVGAFEETFTFTPVAPLPNGTVGVAYPSQSVTAIGGSGPYTYALLNGTLPPGLTIASDGTLSGTPTTAGTYTFGIEATDSSSLVGAVAYSITVVPANTTIVATNAVAVFNAANQPVTLSATVTDGIPVNEGTVTFSVFQDVARMHQIGTSVISGTVTGGAASASFTLPGGTGIGQYTLEAVYNPGPDFNASSDVLHTLSIFAAANSTISVDTLNDVAPNANCNNPVVTTCALRTAIEYGSAGDTINITVSGAITLANGTLTIQSVAANPNAIGTTLATGLTINGLGASTSIVDGNNASTVFTVNSGVTASISSLTIQHGSTSGAGGGVSNSGTLTITASTIANNATLSGDGGGVHNIGGTLTISNSTISGNSAYYNGGGLDNNGGTLTIQNSTISGNTASGGAGGGGLYNLNSGTAIISNSTVAGNSVTPNSRGGAVSNSTGATLTISNSTFSGNSVPGGQGGGLYINSGTLNLLSDIIAGNTAGSGLDISTAGGTLVSLGHNLIGDGTGATGITNGVNNDQVGTTASPIDPLLGPLANNGGSTQTMALPVNSPAYQTGDCAGSLAATPNAPAVTTDQRGENRKSPCDIGAFEETFTFTPNPLPNGVVGDPYSAISTVTTGGTSPYSYIASVATLDGLTITANASGVTVSGIPTAQGVFHFRVTATDTVSRVGSIYYTITVSSPTPTPTNTSTSTPTSTPTNTSTNTATFTPTNTATFTPTNTATSTSSNTATATNTSTNTSTPSATFTPSNTATATNTSTNTSTPSATFTPSNTATATNTSTNTSTSTATFTPSNTATSTTTPTNTATPTTTFTPSASATFTATSTPLPHLDTIGIYRSGTFYLKLHNSSGYADITAPFITGAPIVGDWTGSGIDRVGIANTTNGLFTVCTGSDNTTCNQGANQTIFVYGSPNDIPFSWHIGNGIPDGPALYRPSSGIVFFRTQISTGYATDTMLYGIPGDQPLAGDWIGQGHDTPGLYRPSTGRFYLSNQLMTNGTITAAYATAYGAGGTSYAPLAGSWLITLGHDGIGLYANTSGIFYLKNDPTTTGYADNSFVFGIPGDKPVAGHWQAVYPPAPPASILIAKTAAPTPSNGSVENNGSIGD